MFFTRRTTGSAVLSCLLVSVSGCGQSAIQSDTTLGKVIVYRNGVAYFERSAVLEDDHLQMSVPDRQLDDFLKSLSVHDQKTGELAPVSYRSNASGLVDLDVKLPGPGPHRITLSYVTESPAWKPSYRIALDAKKGVKLQAWAIVDNASGEDWQDIRLGVSSGAALSFKYDLRSLRMVERSQLQPEGLAALAPPNGGAAYGPSHGSATGFRLDEDVLVAIEGEETKGKDPASWRGRIDAAERKLSPLLETARRERDVVKTLCLGDKVKQIQNAKRVFDREPEAVQRVLHDRVEALLAESNECIGAELSVLPGVATTIDASPLADEKAAKKEAPRRGALGGTLDPNAEIRSAHDNRVATKLRDLETRVSELKERVYRNKAQVRLIAKDGDPRAELFKQRLVRSGIPEDRVLIERRSLATGQVGLDIVTEPVGGGGSTPPSSEDQIRAQLAPVESSLFEIPNRMDVPNNGSVMLALYAGRTEGETVYYYDAESPRGDRTFPFRAVRFKNPTRSTLESGPVSVVSDGKFLGEGVSDPIPAGSHAFVPFALDRSIVAERITKDDDAISRIVAARRGIFTSEVVHTKTTRVALFNRGAARALVYIRHTAATGFELAPSPAKAERLGGAQLYKVEVPAGGKLDFDIVEKSSKKQTTDIRHGDGAKLLSVYVEGADIDPDLRTKVKKLVALANELGTLDEQLGGKKAEQKEYRDRLHELHAEVVTLKTVKSSGALLTNLEQKLREASDRVSKVTSEIVALQEKSMVTRIHLQDEISELRLDDKSKEKDAPASKAAARD